MHRALATAAMFKLFVSLVVFFTTQRFDPVLLVSFILMAISALLIRMIQEGEVGFVLVGLILLMDSIGLLLSFTTLSIVPVVSYMFFVIWDAQILMIFRQIQT
ncbi:MAG: hypothetical protein ACO2PM_15860 [Pyrobaculum sp.]|jgi:hypothetical protein